MPNIAVRQLLSPSPWRPTRRGVLLAGAAGLVAPGVLAAAGDVHGQGASFPSKVYELWARRFAEARGIKVSHKATGTTEGFTRYLATASAAFREAVGASQAPKWPGEVMAVTGNDGVADAVRATPGAIGYVSFDRAGAEGLAGVMLRNRDGQFVAASEAGFRSAIANSDLFRKQQDTASLVDQPGAQSWPITMSSFMLLDAQPATTAAVEPTLRFLCWCFMRGDELTRGTGVAALPLAVQARFAGRFAPVVPRDGGRPEYQAF